MSEHCVIRGDFSNWRPVVGRKVLQLTIEVPIEQTKDVLEKLGQPVPGKSLWVAVALLKETSSSSAATKEQAAPPNPLSKIIAIRCNDKRFIQFLTETFLDLPEDFDPAQAVRDLCRVKSRSEIIEHTPPGEVWRQIENNYQLYLTDTRFSQARR